MLANDSTDVLLISCVARVRRRVVSDLVKLHWWKKKGRKRSWLEETLVFHHEWQLCVGTCVARVVKGTGKWYWRKKRTWKKRKLVSCVPSRGQKDALFSSRVVESCFVLCSACGEESCEWCDKAGLKVEREVCVHAIISRPGGNPFFSFRVM